MFVRRLFVMRHRLMRRIRFTNSICSVRDRRVAVADAASGSVPCLREDHLIFSFPTVIAVSLMYKTVLIRTTISAGLNAVSLSCRFCTLLPFIMILWQMNYYK